jgi:hypothetical protein
MGDRRAQGATGTIKVKTISSIEHAVTMGGVLEPARCPRPGPRDAHGATMPTVHAVVVWWDLSASSQTIESLRQYLTEESVPAFSQVPGLRFKMWISDARASLWGAVLLWESAAAAQQPLPSRAAQLIGYPPTLSREFDVEATTEGRYEVQQLALQGLAFAASAIPDRQPSG